jgi:integrase
MSEHFDDLFAWADANDTITFKAATDTESAQAADKPTSDRNGITPMTPPGSSVPDTAPSPPDLAGAALHQSAGAAEPNDYDRSGRPAALSGLVTAAAALRALDGVDDISLRTKADIRSAVRAIAKVTQRSAEDLPLAPERLVPILRSINPARHRWSGKRWANVRSSIKALAIMTGHVVDERATRIDANSPWGQLLDSLPNSPQTCCLRRLARYCCAQAIVPADVSVTTLERFRIWLSRHTLELNPRSVAASTRRAWNLLAASERIPGLRPLPALGDSRRVSLPLSELPPQLVADIQGYGNARRSLDPFSGPNVRRSTETTIRDRQRRLVYSASLLLRLGHPREDVGSLRALITRDHLVAVLQHLLDVSSLKAPRMHHLHTALAFIDAGTTYLQLADDELQLLHDVRKRIKPPKPALSQRAAQRLQPFDDQRVRAKLLALPDKLFAAAELQRKAGLLVRAAETNERAVALALLLVQPLRRRALAAIDADTHFTRDERGRIVRLVLPGSVIKNGIAVDAPMDSMLAKRIEQHLTLFRPAIRGAEKCRFLFPAPDGRARTPDAVARGVTRVVKQELGVAFSIGLIRHIVATMLYESSPQAGPVAQRLLGHTSIKTTEMLYGHLTTRSAHATWAKVIEKQRRRTDPARGKR